MMRTLKNCGLLSLLFLAAFGANGTLAQSYPNKTIRIQTTGTGAGGDLVARLVATELTTSLGQPVVVENNSNTATLAPKVAKAAPDGYTLLVWGGAFWLTPLLRDEPYDPVKDFAPITGLSRAPTILVVHPSLPVNSVKDLIALAKAKPGSLDYASAPTASSSHLAGELFKSMAKIHFVLIKYPGGSPQLTTDLLANRTQFTIGQAASMAPAAKAGKLRALATTGSRRSTLFPDLPTISETLPGFVSESLFAAFAPAKTPDAVLRRLNQEMVRAIEKPEVRDRLLKSGYETADGTPEQLADYVKSEMIRVGKMIKEVGIKED